MAGGIYEQLDWPDSRSDYVQVCDGCHTAIWSTRWDEETTDGVDADLARNGWRHYCLRDELQMLDLCPECAVRALRRGEIRTLADCWIRPARAYRHADQEVYAQLSARERAVASLLLTAA